MKAGRKIIVEVEPFWYRFPLTSSHMCRSARSPISSGVTSQGPIGPKLSQPFPLSHCEDCSWKERSEMSLQTK